MKRFCVVTILFILIVSAFIIPSFASSSIDFSQYEVIYGDQLYFGDMTRSQYSMSIKKATNWSAPLYGFAYFDNDLNCYHAVFACPYNTSEYTYGTANIGYGNPMSNITSISYNTSYTPLYNSFKYGEFYEFWYSDNYLATTTLPVYNSLNSGLDDVIEYVHNGYAPSFDKNPNVDEFIANTLISMGVKFNSYTSALSVAQSAWDYLIDENNWYIGSGDRNDKDIKWDIDSAVSYLNAQSNNYMDWYNGYKVSKDVTVALNKFIIDNYENNGTLSNGTLAGENVYLNTQYMYASSGGSAPGSSFGYSPSAFSFYPASTVTYFNGQYLHDNNNIDLDEFIYTPADVRKFISYPSSAGLIEPPEDSNGTGVITDGNGDTVYNIDLDFPSLDWLADAIQAVLDFLNRLITTIADFLTQILDAILSLFSDAFESLTTFGQGIIEWLYNVIESLGTLGSNYIPSDLWAIILPFIYLNVGIAILMFVLRSH